MSWSLSSRATKAEARETFKRAHQEQSCYNVDGSHKTAMDKIAGYAADMAEASPDGSVINLTSWGHFNTDGTGSASVSVAIERAAT